jgi:hypothetical protein
VLHVADNAKRIFFCMLKYPPCTVKTNASRVYGDEDDVPAEDWAISMPDLFTKNNRYFVSRFEDEYIDLILKHFVTLTKVNNYYSSYEDWTMTVPDGFYQLIDLLSFDSFRRVYLHLFSQVTSKSFLRLYSTINVST